MKRRIVPDAINFHNRTAQRIISFCVNLAACPLACRIGSTHGWEL